MADNYLEYQREAMEARRKKKEQAIKHRQHRYLEAYRKSLKKSQSEPSDEPS